MRQHISLIVDTRLFPAAFFPSFLSFFNNYDHGLQDLHHRCGQVLSIFTKIIQFQPNGFRVCFLADDVSVHKSSKSIQKFPVQEWFVQQINSLILCSEKISLKLHRPNYVYSRYCDLRRIMFRLLREKLYSHLRNATFLFLIAETKSQFARDDPAFLVLLSLVLLSQFPNI